MSNEIDNNIKGILDEIAASFEYDGWAVFVGRSNSDQSILVKCADKSYRIVVEEIR